ncbi:AAA family ATPase [Pseudomonas sp. sp1636]|uniref:ATP-dependent nuclease n=1 Tax=Pseudomonas sp. sp1636 TaxID=3036707 RepID=UPI0025A63A4D|nr:AAA family ATPase [Pseudomonas sp. sp1636]MDM8350503.1 AAA family ATPase [Pseudomonas sp. sp1636]
MPVKVTISNLKSIKQLEFDVPMQGAYILTGANGCGKTSLLVALHRMGASNAFQTGFPGARQANGIDGLEDAIISYAVHGKDVSYRYNDIRWSATPKSNSKLISGAFSEVQFLKADSSRVEPTPNELKGARKYPVDVDLKNFLNSVFDTEKFNHMYKVKLRGRNAEAHLIELGGVQGRRKTYYSEKSFSLGELCVMKLAQRLLSAKNGALYIVDEFEMALHPAAQIRLFEQLQLLSKKYNCSVLVSTHSSSLIKSASRSSIIYLENNAGNVTVHRNVYPTYALQHITVDDDVSVDRLVFVEDISAKYCVENMWRQYIAISNNLQSLPTIRVVVIGGYKEVLRFLDRSSSFIPKHTKSIAALDADAEVPCLPPTVQVGMPLPELTVPQSLYKSLQGQVVFLPWTPEVGFCELFAQDLKKHLAGINQYCGVMNLKVSAAVARKYIGLQGKPLRDECKRIVDMISSDIANKKSCSIERAGEDLFAYLIKEYWPTDKQTMDRLAGKLFS